MIRERVASSWSESKESPDVQKETAQLCRLLTIRVLALTPEKRRARGKRGEEKKKRKRQEQMFNMGNTD